MTDPHVLFNSGTLVLLLSSIVRDQMVINTQEIQQAIEYYERNGSGWSLIDNIDR